MTRLSAAPESRQFYNRKVLDYNTRIATYPDAGRTVLVIAIATGTTVVVTALAHRL